MLPPNKKPESRCINFGNDGTDGVGSMVADTFRLCDNVSQRRHETDARISFMDAVMERRPWRQRLAKACTTNLGAFGVTAVLGLGTAAAILPQCAPRRHPPRRAAQQVVDLTNARRAQYGLPALSVNGALTDAAQAHAADQASVSRMSHAGTDGSDVSARLDRVGYAYSAWGENVAAGYGDAGGVMNGWMNSSGHRANILNGNFTQIGVGLAYSANGTPYWTMDLARPR